AQGVEALALVEAEDGSEDDLEGQGLQAAVERLGDAVRPGGGLAGGGLVDDARQRLHLLAVGGGEPQLALPGGGGRVEEDDRVGAHDRLEDAGALAGVQDVRRRREDLFGLVGIRYGDHRRHADEADREAVAVAFARRRQERERAAPPPDRLQDGG